MNSIEKPSSVTKGDILLAVMAIVVWALLYAFIILSVLYCPSMLTC